MLNTRNCLHTKHNRIYKNIYCVLIFVGILHSTLLIEIVLSECFVRQLKERNRCEPAAVEKLTRRLFQTLHFDAPR